MNKSNLSEAQRKVIETMLKAKTSQSQIAKLLGYHRSTISREIRRNISLRGGYRYQQAQKLSLMRQKDKRGKAVKITAELELKAQYYLLLKYSPMQISYELKAQGINLSHETIYRYLIKDKKQGGKLYKHLRINGKRRYRRRVKAQRSKIPNRVDIEQRPRVINQRKELGHWEVDLVTYKDGYLLTSYERKSRIALAAKLTSKYSLEVSQTLIRLMQGYRVTSLTYDNGLEFAKHEQVNQELGSDSYFCKPYASWEKGGVENFNGLIRQYLPKQSSLKHISADYLDEIVTEINSRPKKVLNWKKPIEFELELTA